MVTKWVLVLVLVAVFAVSGIAGPQERLDSMTVKAFRTANMPSTGTAQVPVAVVKGIINDCIQTVSVNFPAVQKSDTLVVTPSAQAQALPTDFISVTGVFRLKALDDGRTVSIPLDTMPADPFNKLGESNQANDPTSNSSPRYYRIVGLYFKEYPPFSRITIGGTPSAEVDSILLEYVAAGAYLSADSSQTDLSPEYRDALRFLVQAELFAVREMYGPASYWLNLYNGLGPKNKLTVEALKK